MNFSGSGNSRKTDNPVTVNGRGKNNSYDYNTSSSGSTVEQQNQSSNNKNNGFTIPSISLPKGGGAIRGIGEKFAANPVTGTGSLSVPIFTSPGRSGFGPSLSLTYDSGSGNGPFGFGWSLSLPSITRKTSKGIPKYQDADESDVFILSGAEDLVPVFAKDKNGDWEKDENGNYVIDEQSCDESPCKDYIIRKYKPRTEGLFARIERWTHKTTGDVHWRSISKDNILTVYGKSINSRIADPTDENGSGKRVFSWLICESYDDKGNAIVYEYAKEDEKGIDDILLNINERNRIRNANTYIKRIFYGNRKPLLIDHKKTSFRKSHLEVSEDDLSSADWMFEVVFDYNNGQFDSNEGHYKEIPIVDNIPAEEQHQLVEATASDEGGIWSDRPDIFSTYRSGFEIRTYRRCHRVLMFHHFSDLGTEPYLVRSTEFDYSDFDYSKQPFTIQDELKHTGSTRFASFIQTVVQSGYLKDETKPFHEVNGIKYLTYIKKSIPPLEFEYSKCIINHDIKELDESSLENLPIGIDGSSYQFVDLDGEGVSGILTEQADTWFYKPNMGDGKFGSIEVVSTKPSIADLNNGGGGRQQLMDLAGDGQLDLVEMSKPVAGFYERTNDRRSWENFVPFQSIPNVLWNDPNLRLVDLTGDGHADILITENEVFTWYKSLAEKGFESSLQVFQELDEEKGPKIVLNDSSQSIYLADMSGDGMSDLVRIKNGEVCYWPNLGYGRFGSKVTMDNSPWFDTPDQFDSKKIRLGDIDGTGVTDIIYIGSSLDNGGIQIYFNQSGNSWSDAYHLDLGLQIDNQSSIQVADLFGNGTACLVWSSPLPGHSRKPLRYLDLMGGIQSEDLLVGTKKMVGTKPHLLVKSANNLGAETRVKYVSSTKFYLEDKAAGKPWITRLSFPIHVVEQVETYDYISRNLFVTIYAYHHGYFDGIEQEFRGFGMVEQFDTEKFATLSNNDSMPDAENIDEESHIPPVLTKTWFHTGIYHGRHHVSDYFVGEYYMEPDWVNDPEEVKKHLLDDTIIPTRWTKDEELTVDEEYEACRALRGSMLRQEVFSKDGSEEKENIPYTVTEQNFTIHAVQPRGENRHAVFFTHAKEAITYNYERNPEDPRTSHMMTLEVDDFGNVLKQVQIAYRREKEDSELESERDHNKQKETKMIYTENRVTKSIDTIDAYRTPLQCESITFELTDSDLPETGPVERFKESYFIEDPTNPSLIVLNFKDSINYEDSPTIGKQRRPIEHIRTLYRKNDLSSILSLENMDSLALPGNSYKLAFTPGLIDRIYKRSHPDKPDEIENLLPIRADVLGGHGADNGGYQSSQDLKARGLFPEEDKDDHWWVPSGSIFFSPQKNDTDVEELEYAVKHFFLPNRYSDPFENTTIVKFDSANDLLIIKVQDPVGNIVTAGERDLVSGNITKTGVDYRLLQPLLIMDPNQNCSEVAFDVLGMVIGAAIMGKPKPANPEGDILDNTFNRNLTTKKILEHITTPLNNPHSVLKKATTRIIYDLFSYYNTKTEPDPKPSVVYTMVRETHFADSVNGNQQETKIQHSFSYSDGFGREIQKKIQAEKGPLDPNDPSSLIVDPRWVSTGWTIFNNKGKAVRQYEPFFSDTHNFEFRHLEGVSPVMFYDPVGRIVAVIHPNHTYEKIVFNNWKQISYDVNDTILLDPRTDSDVSNIVSKYFESLPNPTEWKTWYQERITDLDMPKEERSAAEKTESHANTPTTSFVDSLGRTFITFAHNGLELDGITIKRIPIILDMDIEGNTRQVLDEIKQNGDKKKRIVMIYDYDMLGNVIHQANMDAGERWMLQDVLGNQIRGWDSRSHTFISEYDNLRRQIRSYVVTLESINPPQMSSMLVERIVYGEQHPHNILFNLRGKIFLHLDQAGMSRMDKYDFKGNMVHASRSFTKEYKGPIDWSIVDSDELSIIEINLPKMLETEVFTSRTNYDALNRPIQIIFPHSSKSDAKINVVQPIYNKANLLDSLDAWLELDSEPDLILDHSTATQHFVKNIDYNAKGQRDRIEYGNDVATFYSYDHVTFRLKNIMTMREGNVKLQNLSYFYDPVGNIVSIGDDAQQTIFFKGQVVKPISDYTYDAIYRLISAEGREHIGQSFPPQTTWNDEFRILLEHPHDGEKMRKYLEVYEYDPVGNILSLTHKIPDSGNRNRNNWRVNWTRTYDYQEDSLIEPNKKNNRLSSTTVVNDEIEEYEYDPHGNIVRMPHLAKHHRLNKENMHYNFNDQLLQIDTRNGDTDEGIVYYVYDASGQRTRKVWEKSVNLIEERLYLGPFEIFRKRDGSGKISLERETLHIMDDKQRISLVETRTRDINGREPEVPPQLIRYQFSNHLGSASLELDDKARIISYEEYTPYGSTSFQSGEILAEVKLKRYRYIGMERDKETGFGYHGARYYASWLGRWTNCDPNGIDDGINIYAYVTGNPICKIDTTGLEGDKITIYHRTTEKNAVNMTKEGMKTNLSRAGVWAGGGVYASSSPDIPGTVGARGNAVVGFQISTLNMGEITDPKFIQMQQATKAGRWNEVLKLVGSQMRDAKKTALRMLGRKPSDVDVARNMRDYMNSVMDKLAPGKDVVRWKNPDGTYTYVVRQQSALIGEPSGKPTIVGRFKGSEFKPTKSSTAGGKGISSSGRGSASAEVNSTSSLDKITRGPVSSAWSKVGKGLAIAGALFGVMAANTAYAEGDKTGAVLHLSTVAGPQSIVTAPLTVHYEQAKAHARVHKEVVNATEIAVGYYMGEIEADDPRLHQYLGPWGLISPELQEEIYDELLGPGL